MLKVTNKNYCATVVEITRTVELPNCDNVVAAKIGGNSVIVAKNTPIGTRGLFFPLESQLSGEFLKKNNLYRHQELNENPELKGYFEDHGRIRAVSFRGNRSDGFFIPVSAVDYASIDSDGVKTILVPGEEFNEMNGHKICEKYIPSNARTPGEPNKKGKKAVKISKLVENQFRLHYDTAQLKKNIHLIHPDDLISISEKWHGTSFVVGNILTLRPLTWRDKIAKWLGVAVQDKVFDLVYSSRKVVKNGYLNANPVHFYSYDLWEEIKNQVKDCLPKGVTVYGEAVGYLNTGKCIQKGYHYGAEPNTFDIYIYRVTYTNPDGKVFEFSWNQMKEFCNYHGLNMVKELYYGYARNVFPGLEIKIGEDGWLEAWQDQFLQKLISHKDFNMADSMCPHNLGKVPAEGIVIRKDRLDQSECFKLKNGLFMEWETKQLDKGEVDLETEQSVEGEDEG